MRTTLLNGVTAAGAGPAHQFSDHVRRALGGSAYAQSVLTGTATAALEGSLDGTNWFPVASYTASGAGEFKVPPYLRGNVTAYTSGAVTLMVDIV